MTTVFRDLILVWILFGIPCSLTAAGIDFRIIDSKGAPVKGAVFRIRDDSVSGYRVAGSTDTSGCATLKISLPVALEVKAPGFDPARRRIETQPDGEIVIRLNSSVFFASIEVIVKDTPVLDGSTEQTSLTIERSGARTVYDAVDKLIPSAHVPRRGVLGHGLGISNSIALRGMGGSPTTQLLMVVDGRPDVMGLMGHPIPDFYSLTDVGSLRITQGPASVLYGNRAMAGVIEVLPSRPKPGFHTELTASLGSYYTGQNRLLHSGELGNFRYSFAGGIGYTNGHRENSGFRDQDGTLRLSYALNPTWSAVLDGRYGHFTVEDPGPVEAPTPGNWARVGRGGYSIGLENRSERSHGSVRFFGSHGHHMLSDGFRSVDRNIGFRLIETFDVGPAFELDVGGDAARYGGRARNILTDINFGEHDITEGGGFGRVRWDAVEGLQFNAGFRYDRNSVFGGVVAAEFGATYRLSEDYALNVSIARGFRNPTIRELYLFPAPTPTLKPERMWNYQATFQFRPVARVLAWVTGYYSDVDSLIVATGRYPNLVYENIGKASNRGLEVNGRYRLTGRINLFSGYAWFGSNNTAPYVPENKWTYMVDLDLSRAYVSFGGNWTGRVRANTAGTVILDGRMAATLKCTVPIGSHLSLSAAVDNLFDQQYEELAGYPMPGINAQGGFHIRF